MFAYPIRTAVIAVTAMIGLSGCAYNGLYSGASVGIGTGYGYGGYDPYYGGYGYGAGYPYYGWYDGFYYPGSGYYVYDRYRRPHRWSDRHRRYWTSRREQSLAQGFRNIATNWSGFDSSGDTQQTVRSVDRVQRSVDSPSRIERGSRAARAERMPDRTETRSSTRTERRSQARSSCGNSDSARARGRNRDGNRDD